MQEQLANSCEFNQTIILYKPCYVGQLYILLLSYSAYLATITKVCRQHMLGYVFAHLSYY